MFRKKKHWNNAGNSFYTFIFFGVCKELGKNRKKYEEAISVQFPYHGEWTKLFDFPFLRRIYIRTKIKGYLG